ncbi:methyl-accepting chemotaxis protein [Aliiglaciecola sp. LCG003]|uniref:methyl-accepting chemotaxis protein n=1 Tax=Aliiglaciecola sp. LCG003 TaxID=3053655 RepID=UPI0025742C67|nr:methyl-accepting chemotaxis protein [Aliiglaciecola sp. LCG003]WJG09907.1 methyl-accepting chemotaxis protein [Aliiglaciecola sp. LCG003]
MFSKFKIGTKIQILGFCQLSLMIVMGIIAMLQMAKLGEEIKYIAEEDIPLANMLTLISEHQAEQSILFERALFHMALAEQNIGNGLGKLSNTKQQFNSITTKVLAEIDTAESHVNKMLQQNHSEKINQKSQSVLKNLKKIEQHYKTLNSQIVTLLAQSQSMNISDLAEQAIEVEELQKKVTEEISAQLNDIQNFTLEAAITAEHDEQRGIIWIIVTFVIATIIGIILPIVIGRAIARPVNQLAKRLAEIAEGDGDLTVSLNDTAKDEIGDVARAFNKFTAVLRVLISNTNLQADELGVSSQIAMQTMSETEHNVSKQRLETEMVATAVTEMSTTTQEVARNAAHSAEVTQRVKDNVMQGKKDALDTQSIMQQLSDEVSEASNVIQNLVSETNNIGSVLEAIQGIAEQTNLLALNAAIEAARAGETGRGFAVVADEVRTLAQRTQTSTVDIQALLVRLKAEASNAVASMSKGSDSASICLQKSATTSETFETTAVAIEEISDLNLQVAAAVEEQSAVAEEINRNLINISQLADVTEEGAKATMNANNTISQRVTELHANLKVFIV